MVQSQEYQELSKTLKVFHWGDESKNMFSYPEQDMFDVPGQEPNLAFTKVKVDLQQEAEKMLNTFKDNLAQGGPA